MVLRVTALVQHEARILKRELRSWLRLAEALRRMIVTLGACSAFLWSVEWLCDRPASLWHGVGLLTVILAAAANVKVWKRVKAAQRRLAELGKPFDMRELDDGDA